MADKERPTKVNAAVTEYKTILRRAIDSRPSGTRGRLARALGKNRSFVSHIINPAYATPIPARHLETVLELCHISDEDRRRFIDAYERAHPGRLRPVVGGAKLRSHTILLPDLNDVSQNAELDRLVDDFVVRISRFAKLFENSRETEDQNGSCDEETD